MEQWRTVVHNGETYDNYEVSTEGRVRSLNYHRERRMKVLKQTRNKKTGYFHVNLWKNGSKKRYYVHVLVANIFIPNPDNLPEVNHINEDKSNNRVENLEWTTHKKNINHGTRTERQRRTMTEKHGKRVRCIETGQIFDSAYDVERQTGLNHGNISRCCRGLQKTCGGLHWEFVD